MPRHLKTPSTAIKVIVSIDGEDHEWETPRDYTERNAYDDILGGEVEDVEQILRVTPTGCVDITAAIAGLIAAKIEFGFADDYSEGVKDFAERFGGYDRPVSRAERAEQRAEYRGDCAREDRI